MVVEGGAEAAHGGVDAARVVTAVVVHGEQRGADLVAVLALVVGVFRSLRQLLLALFTIGTGVAAAAATTLAVFGEIHILTLVFGASLIGISIDYALHFLCDAYRGPAWTVPSFSSGSR